MELEINKVSALTEFFETYELWTPELDMSASDGLTYAIDCAFWSGYRQRSIEQECKRAEPQTERQIRELLNRVERLKLSFVACKQSGGGESGLEGQELRAAIFGY